jgi:hypothetical protein
MDSLRVVSGLPHYTTIMPRNKSRANRPARLRGRGDYSTEITAITNPISRLESKIDHLEKKLVKNPMSKSNAAATIGRTLGNFAGQGDLGELAGSTLAKWFGHGDYHVKTNSLMGPSSTVGATFSKEGRRGTRIMEREYIGDITSGPLSGGSTAFDITGFNLNPTDVTTFPWLSRVASLYDQWEPNGIVFEFISTSSDFNGASQALGAVVMATDYDSFDPPYTSKQQMENADYACSTKPSENLLHGIECDKRERATTLLYTSTINGAPVTMTTLGRFQVATQGCSVANVTLGELWISYDVTFYKKQLTFTDTLSTPFLDVTGTIINGDNMFLGTIGSSDTITLTANGQTLSFNNPDAAKYQLVYYLDNTEFSSLADLNGSVPTNCTFTSTAVFDPTAGSQLLMVTMIITATAPNASLVTLLKTAVGSSHMRMSVVEVPSAYTFSG